jgi:inhibitor of cysteine peptidase
MRTAYAIIITGCLLILAAGMIAGCTESIGTTTAPPAEVVHPNPTAMSVTTVPFVPGPQPASVPVTVTPAISGTSPESGATIRTVFVNSTSNGGLVTVPFGDRVLVRLIENPTTGYTWNATTSKGLAIVTDTYTAPDAILAGAPGSHEWILSPRAIDTYTFTAVSHRPWEEIKGADTSFSIVIQAINPDNH